MTKDTFLEEVADILEFEGAIDFNSEISIDSLNTLSLIAFLDEEFSIKATAKEFKNISIVKDIVDLIGQDNIL